MKKLNILFLFADDMRYDTIGILGNKEIKTPNLDKIAKSGTSFTNAHIPGGSIAAVCMPSRAMLNTGRSLFKLKDSGSYIPENHALLGETLKNAGYRTFGTGKWHNGYRAYARSFTDGGDIFFGGMYDHWKVPVYDYDDTGDYVHVLNDVMNPSYNNTMVPVRSNHVHWGKHSTDIFADLSCQWLESYDDDKPFYMYVSYMAPHDPRTVPQEFFDMYNMDKISVPENFLSEHPFDFGIRQVRDETLEQYPRRESEIKRHIRDYYAMISHLDASIGRIIDSLIKSGKYEDTIIIFSSDNGLAIGQHGLMGKQNCYEHSIKVPLIFTGPCIPSNEIRDTFVYLMDIFPTLCETVGIETPETVEGISMKKAFSSKDAVVRDELFLAYKDKIRGIKNNKYKLLIYKYKTQKTVQLFDIENDPYEIKNLAGLEEYEDIQKELMDKTKAYADDWGDIELETGVRFWKDEYIVGPCARE